MRNVKMPLTSRILVPMNRQEHVYIPSLQQGTTDNPYVAYEVGAFPLYYIVTL